MKHLADKKTGDIIKISTISVENNHVICDHFDGGNNSLESNQQSIHKFENYQINDDLKKETNIYNNCIAKLQLEKFGEFTVEDEGQNWLLPNRPIRLFIPRNWIIDEVLIEEEHLNLAKIINREQLLNAKASEKFLFKGKKYLTAYFSSVNTSKSTDLGGLSDQEIIMPYIQSGKIVLEELTN